MYIHVYLEYNKHNNAINILNDFDLFGLFAPSQSLTNKFKEYFNMKKEQQNLKNSTENKNITSNDNSNSTPYQCKDNSSISGSKLKDIKIRDKFIMV